MTGRPIAVPDPCDTPRRPFAPDGNGYCYVNEQHFDETMTRIARDHLAGRARLFERTIVPGTILLFVIAGGLGCVRHPALGFALLALAAPVLIFYLTREVRGARRVERDHLCFRCGYPLLHLRTDGAGSGRCPECGADFHDAYYRRPPPMYERDA